MEEQPLITGTYPPFPRRPSSVVPQNSTAAIRRTVTAGIQDEIWKKLHGWVSVLWNVPKLVAIIVLLILYRSHRCNDRLQLWLIGELLCITLNLCLSLYLVSARRLRLLTDDYVILTHCSRPIHFTWWIVGFYWVLNTPHSCQKDVGPMYHLATTLLFINFFDFFKTCLITIVVLPVTFLCMRRLLDLLPRSERGASPYSISQLESCTYQEGMFDNLETNSDCSACPSSNDFSSSSSSTTTSTSTSVGDSVTTDADAENDLENASLLGNKKKQNENAYCSVCCETYQSGEKLRILRCHPSHHFHSDCIDRWLAFNATCPLCRKPIQGGFLGTET